MSRLHDYAPHGERAVSYEPAGKGTRLNVLGAFPVEGGFFEGLKAITEAIQQVTQNDAERWFRHAGYFVQW